MKWGGVILWRLVGISFLAIGAMGLFLPVLPTTVFWIIAALCFSKSDPHIRDWIYQRPGIGPQVKLFIEEGRMTRTGKRGALFGMSLAAGLVIWLLWERSVFLYGSLTLIAIGAIFVLSRPGAISSSEISQDTD